MFNILSAVDDLKFLLRIPIDGRILIAISGTGCYVVTCLDSFVRYRNGENDWGDQDVLGRCQSLVISMRGSGGEEWVIVVCELLFDGETYPRQKSG